jgi:hypothetical protein
MRDEGIPARTDAATKGYMAGLRGQAEGSAAATVGDEDGAFDAGAAAGKQRRLKMIAEKCGGDASEFDNWLKANGSEVESQSRAQIKVKIQKQMWTERAAEYAGAWTKTDAEKLTDQYYAWIYIIGSSPASMGGEWMSLWNSKRVYSDEFPGRSSGSW